MDNLEQDKRNINCLIKEHPEYKETLTLCLELLQEKYYRSRRTKDGLEKAKSRGKQLGQLKGAKLDVKKAKRAKSIILRVNKSFCGSFGDVETLERVTVCRNTYYKYKRELMEEIENTSIDYVLKKYPFIF
jgi:DNA invertase Pin-like site-specific DNA recombinase